MNYFKLRRSWQPEIIGVKTATAQLEINEKSFLERNKYKRFIDFFDWEKYWKEINKLPDFEIKIDKCELIKGAKLTDFMLYRTLLPQIPYVVSEKIKSIFDALDINGVYFYPISIYNGKEKIDANYFLLHTMYVNYDSVVLQKTLLIDSQDDDSELVFKPSTLKELEHFREEHRFSEFKKLTLKKENLYSKDFIESKMAETFISEKLRDIFEKEKITGVFTVKCDFLSIE